MTTRAERLETADGVHVVGIVSHEGKDFSAGGGLVAGRFVVGYPTTDGRLQLWDGTDIGTWRATTWWKHPRGILSDRVYQGTAVVNGATYTGRGAGVGMLWRGRMVARDVARIGRAVEMFARLIGG